MAQSLKLYTAHVSISGGSRRKSKSHQPQADTGQEAVYLRTLSERQTPVMVQLRGGESVHGWIEYFDDNMIRLTREDKPNLFIYKRQILTITEQGRRHVPRRNTQLNEDPPA